jgi:hypothetical protein
MTPGIKCRVGFIVINQEKIYHIEIMNANEFLLLKPPSLQGMNPTKKELS